MPALIPLFKLKLNDIICFQLLSLWIMKRINIILILSILLTGCSSYYKEVISSLESKYKKGDIIIVNDWALLRSNKFFDLHSNKLKIIMIEKIQRDSSISWFGHWGSEHEIYLISATRFQPSDRDVFIDGKVLKILNPKDSSFYFIDGVPCYTYRDAIHLIQNKRISEMSVIPVESAIKIWGTKTGKNGAIMMNTKK